MRQRRWMSTAGALGFAAWPCLQPIAGANSRTDRLAAALAATRASGTRMADQRVVIHGAGTAGVGIADMLRDVMAGDGLGQVVDGVERPERDAAGNRGVDDVDGCWAHRAFLAAADPVEPAATLTLQSARQTDR